MPKAKQQRQRTDRHHDGLFFFAWTSSHNASDIATAGGLVTATVVRYVTVIIEDESRVMGVLGPDGVERCFVG